MLNLGDNKINHRLKMEDLKSLQMTTSTSVTKKAKKVALWTLVILLVVSFLPWTQNIRAKGLVTTLQPSQRPQTLQSVIAGKIEKWFVKEGQFVKKGDTILFLSEIKDEYFDPQLLSRTEDQIKSKESSVIAYMEKIKSLDNQIDALIKTKAIKLEQAKNYLKQAALKVQTDSIDWQAAITNYSIALEQNKRMEKLYEDGLKSLTDLESRKLKLQETQAKKNSAENKLLSSRNELLNAKSELNSIDNQYKDKLAKSESEKFESMSNMYDAEATVSKMQTSYMNYTVRNSMYYITAPQDGFITKALRDGIGETVKQGEPLVSIMPSKFDLAVEMFVDPNDLPLLHVGNEVRFIFDGWPSVVFSGWPTASYGTFGGKVVAIDNFTTENGKYRVLVAEDKAEGEWPKQLRVGSGAQGIALLNNVPIAYELWRNLNGFPADYYTPEKVKEKEKKNYDNTKDANEK
ncbi:MAG: HlyD family efflux transporter periplasmic adaptor subunit [Bacteroidetes bacterium]|nr:HlyD family efflux transporter periplasmic adaptor subunit [Bacteroidota bacterium]